MWRMARDPFCFDLPTRDSIVRGVSALGEAVRVTSGRRSKRVLIGRKWDPALVGYDGMTIASLTEVPYPHAAVAAEAA